ncbi:MAG: heparan-alpha-glucosaminide N-acetyltransferase domain-containing protein [Candidatus Thermoplasmatota archaeon]|nr:heparan-alpha-glucosaminide N-acetyltransferase domain-containing protein [Candidatus Thermoplasmatota archaeon]
MRRFASIDMMRGFAIWMMVIFHVIMRYYDHDWVKDGDLDGVPLGGILVFLIIIYFSAWAGDELGRRTLYWRRITLPSRSILTSSLM